MSVFKLIKACGLAAPLFICSLYAPKLEVAEQQYQLPVLKGKSDNPVLRIKLSNVGRGQKLNSLTISTQGTTDLKDIKNIRIWSYGKDSMPGTIMATKGKLFAAGTAKKEVTLAGDIALAEGNSFLWVSYELSDKASLFNLVDARAVSLKVDGKTIAFAQQHNDVKQRIGVAVRQHDQDGVHTSRIPGLATTNKGTLIAVFDARYESARDLQGHMDIGLHRSEDGGNTWKPLQIAIDMKEWGGLPQKFNGVSDACILVDKNSNTIYIAGLWMHGVKNAEGKWLENLNNESKDWNHQWKTKGSQPGFGVKETSQFMIVKSTDDGKTWSEPVNLTKEVKKEEWWLWAPAPGQGYTMKDGTLVFPTQGRNRAGKGFSNLTYSKDGGKTWKTTNAAGAESTTENMSAELSDGSILITMRSGANKGRMEGNGRIMAVTKDLGESWTAHPGSRKALIEPGCMASIIRHDYRVKGMKKSVLLFSNPDSKTTRNRMTIKYSIDDGMTWASALLLDEFNSRGYSCLTSIDSETIGIFYESSQADIAFQAVKLADLITERRDI